ncbi:glycosyltransferase family 39 protein [Pseudovibrio exalbescens]|uniref:ArnT family glycosyltransferase n=1 Tax=Pseudovibrio exalbescens TaxID=197461 RepID=UPI002366FB22|nr:glycosyltransferase family 39 protein [Pseudovibrio exalbescens]MDD7910722.1 glycosyltransferase family 39 protein [Pseudovibrio exalbescens]
MSQQVQAGQEQLTGFHGALQRPQVVIALIIGYCGLNLLFRAAASPVIGIDDMFENVLVQELHAGYMLRQPPLYEWLLYLIQQLVGPTIWSFQILKYGLVCLAGVFFYALARRALRDSALAAVSTFSLVLFYQVGFNLHEGVTHTAVLMATVCATFLCFIRLVEAPGLWRAALLGVVLGLGMLSKHSFWLVPVALAFAVVSLRPWRERLPWDLLPLAILVGAVVYAPYLLWTFEAKQSLLSNSLNVMVVGEQQSHLLRAAQGVGRLSVSLLGFSMPFLVLWALFFLTGGLATRERVEGNRSLSPLAQLIGRYIFVAIVITGLGVLLSGATYIKERHMHPILLLLPIYAFALVEFRGYSEKRLWWFMAVIAAVISLVFLIRLPDFIAPDRTICGSKCRVAKPYPALAKKLLEWDQSVAEGTLIALDSYLGGNLRAAFPEARLVIREFRPTTPGRASCFVVWEQGDGQQLRSLAQAAKDERFTAAMELTAPEVLSSGYFKVAWPHLWLPTGHRVTNWAAYRIEPTNALCQ